MQAQFFTAGYERMVCNKSSKQWDNLEQHKIETQKNICLKALGTYKNIQHLKGQSSQEKEYLLSLAQYCMIVLLSTYLPI